MIDLRCGDNRQILPTLADCSIDAVVCDPPYELGFMGRKWDASGIAHDVSLWREVLRVLKPGGHLVAFGGTRTYHRMTCAIEDAGFEIRDCLTWLYGSGFPKSKNVALSIDKGEGHPNRGRAIPTASRYQACDITEQNKLASNPVEAYTAKSESGKHWQGWGTALKPAFEPAVLARKPLDGTVAANVLQWGTGAVNVDGCRIVAEKATGWGGGSSHLYDGGLSRVGGKPRLQDYGRWPANVLLDTEAATLLDAQAEDAPARFFYTAKASTWEREIGLEHLPRRSAGELTSRDNDSTGLQSPRAGAGRASDGRANMHPTVKPIDLMRWLCRLVTPQGGVVLDPFMGSGSTGIAAVLESFGFVGLELDPLHVDIARGRIDAAQRRAVIVENGKIKASDVPQAQMGLFDAPPEPEDDLPW